MNLEAALVEHLKADTSLQPLVASRIYPVFASDTAAAPYIVYRRLSTQWIGTMQSNESPKCVLQITCWSNSYMGAQSLADLVRYSLDAYSGQMGSDNAVAVQRSSIINESDAFEPRPDMEMEQMFGRQLDFEFWITE